MHAPRASAAVSVPRDPLRWFAPLFARMLDRIDGALAEGAIEATLPDGSKRRLGGHGQGPVAVVVLHRWRAMLRLATGGSVGWYEGWVAGDWSSPDPVPLFDLFMRNGRALGSVGRAGRLTGLARRVAHWSRRNHRANARRNIQFHYDLGNDFYRAWLDPSMTYSSAIFAEPQEPLETAQDRKLQEILDRTATMPGDTILEIGCGWGSFAERAARAGRRVHGLTLSAEQKRFVEQRVAAAGIEGVEVSLTDYRDATGRYDAIASIEMVEAVGREYWPSYLDTIAARLKPGGRAALQYIAIDDALFDAYANGVDFIQAYVFPGGLLLSSERFRRLAEARGLRWQDEHRFGIDYAETLKRWRDAFDAAVAAGTLPGDFPAGFVELWRYYLMYCEGGFRGGGIHVAQVTLVKEG
ncbi:class I SAM-dependent methyltransferase [Sphingomonas sp. ac-8]|uniref:class I SAM-dependent methyltransferase n=1 Tax=Sphingomonas sp. ac-8 TaxID=3242977 RepID=UPI003A7FE22E